MPEPLRRRFGVLALEMRGGDLVSDAAAAARAGVDGMSVGTRELQRRGTAEVERVFADAGLAVSSVGAIGPSLTCERDRDRPRARGAGGGGCTRGARRHRLDRTAGSALGGRRRRKVSTVARAGRPARRRARDRRHARARLPDDARATRTCTRCRTRSSSSPTSTVRESSSTSGTSGGTPDCSSSFEPTSTTSAPCSSPTCRAMRSIGSAIRERPLHDGEVPLRELVLGVRRGGLPRMVRARGADEGADDRVQFVRAGS